MISGIIAVEIISKHKDIIEFYKKDETEKFRSYRFINNRNVVFAFDAKTKTQLNVRFNFNPNMIKGLTKITDISNKSNSSAIGRVFKGVDSSCLFLGSFESEIDFVNFLKSTVLNNKFESTDDPIKLDLMVSRLIQLDKLEKPKGNQEPNVITQEINCFLREPKVKAWVLKNANGFCEYCDGDAPFLRVDGSPYLEVHHLKKLSESGFDTISNVVALCPNCHREFHYGTSIEKMKIEIVNKVSRLVTE